MTRYLISFPSGAMDHIPAEELPAVGEAAHAVVQEAMDAGVWVFGGGLAEDVDPVMVAGDGTITHSSFAWCVWNGPCLSPGSTSYMLAPMSSASMCAPTQASLIRQPSRSSVRSHSGSLLRLKTFIPQAYERAGSSTTRKP